MPPCEISFDEFALKMQRASVNEAAIRAFQHSYESLAKGQSGLIPDSCIEPAGDLPRLADIFKELAPAPELLPRTVMIKLNGGLGTSMGLDRAKSLLKAKQDLTFLDLIARQVLHLKQQHGTQLR